MPALQINFNHPVKGTASLKQLIPLQPHVLNIQVNSGNSNQVEVPTDQCAPGKWMMTLNWQYDGRSFTYNQPFEIIAKTNFFGDEVNKRRNVSPAERT